MWLFLLDHIKIVIWFFKLKEILFVWKMAKAETEEKLKTDKADS